MDLLKQIEVWKTQIKQLEEEKQKYINEEYHGLDDDLVEWEEKDDICIGFNEKINQLENDIDLAEDYLREKYQPVGE